MKYQDIRDSKNVGYFGHTWPRPPKALAPTCRKLCLFETKKSTCSFNLF